MLTHSRSPPPLRLTITQSNINEMHILTVPVEVRTGGKQIHVVVVEQRVVERDVGLLGANEVA